MKFSFKNILTFSALLGINEAINTENTDELIQVL